MPEEGEAFPLLALLLGSRQQGRLMDSGSVCPWAACSSPPPSHRAHLPDSSLIRTLLGCST